MTSFLEWNKRIESLAAWPEEKLASLDIAELNLFAASGLPGFDPREMLSLLETLDRWTTVVERATNKWLPRFHANPADFGDSLGQFKMMALATVLQRDIGVHYNMPFAEGDYDGRDPRDHFLHGLLTEHGGTCVTMPVLYIAVGRRLGYPLHLVEACQHSFVRWEGEGERFNIEATSPGFVSHEDDYYKKWPFPISEAEVRRGVWLRNLTRREEFGTFVGQRATVFRERLNPYGAVRTSYHAGRLAPRNPTIHGLWRVNSYLCLAWEATGLASSGCFHLRDVHLPKPTETWQREAFMYANHHLNRLKRLYPPNQTLELAEAPAGIQSS